MASGTQGEYPWIEISNTFFAPIAENLNLNRIFGWQ
jgi:hypothetical protein